MVIRIIFLIVIIFNASNLKAQITVTDNTGRTELGKNVLCLNPEKEISIEEASLSSGFIKNEHHIPNLGVTVNSVWFKFSVNNSSSQNKLLFEIAYPIFDEVELFVADGKGGFKSILLGEIKKFNDRKYKHPHYIFDLDVRPNTSQDYYLRIRSTEQIILPAFIYRPVSIWENVNQENLLIGIFIGIVLIMLLYNLFLYFSVRDVSYLYYVIYVFFVGLTQTGIKGYTYQYLWPEHPDLQLKSVVITSCISVIAALFFTRNFLQTKLYARKANFSFIALLFLFSASILLTIAGFVQQGFLVMQIATTLSAVAILIISIVVMSKKYGPARFFFAAWSVLLTGAVIFLLKDYGILPYNNFTSYSMLGASAIEMSLLSFGLADRINILKKEKETSQALALSIAKENERIIREQNVILEAKVNVRTSELVASNHELNATLENLQQAQIQLVESEKMASLGQLTAGIAHEINNPINFVTSNVAPLQRDVNILMEVIETIQQVGLTELPVAEKQKQIEDYKEEVDYDYLKIEIKHLLKGISEGASRTAEIVKGLRVFSRLDEDDLKQANINECLESTMVIVNNLLGENIAVKTEFSELPLIECYPGKLNQVFLNVISNAAHAIKKRYENEKGGELAIQTYHQDNEVVICLSDNGTGMDDNTIKKIFEPFFTTKEVGEGTGLGMSIAYNTIKKHNGKIEIDSVIGEGTKFTIKLPLIHNINET